MKKFLILISYVLVGTRLLGQATDAGYELPKPIPPSGATPPTVIKPGGSYAPTAYNDARPGMYDVFIWGGHRSYGTIAERDAARWKKEGMSAYVAETGKTYRLNASMVWVDTNPGSDIIYLKDYGAIGNGVVDDTVAVQAAIAAAENKILDIGKGLYSISPITVDKPVSIIGHHLRGQTGAATPATAAQYSGFIRKTGTSGALITVDGAVHGEMHYVYISGNDVAGAHDGLVINSGAGGAYIVDHVVSVNHTGSGFTTSRQNTTVNGLSVQRCIEYGVRVNGASGCYFNNLQIYAISGVGMRIDEGARYSRFSNLSILQCGATGVSIRASQIYFDGGLIGETGQSALTFGTSTIATTNILVQDLITRNANCQIIPSLTGFTPEAEGSQAAIYFAANNELVTGIQFSRCSINVPHPDSSVQTTFGNRKASYCLNYVETVTPATARQTFVDTYFETTTTVNGAYPAWVPDRFVLINSSISGMSSQIHYFGTAAAFGNAIAVIKGISTTPVAGSYPLVWDSVGQRLYAQPTAYNATFAWKPMPTKRVKYYVYETFPTANIGVTVGSHNWSFTGTGSPAGTQVALGATLGHPSGIKLQTGTVTPSAANWSSRLDIFALDTNERITYNIMFRIPTLSTATDRFILNLGPADTVGATAVDGLQLSYTDDAASGNFRLKTSANSVSTYGDAAAPAVANAWNGASLTATPTAANMSVNGVAFPTVTGTIPSGTARSFGIVETIYAGSAITAARGVDVDWFEVIIEDITQDYVPIANLEFFENMTLPWHDLLAFQLE